MRENQVYSTKLPRRETRVYFLCFFSNLYKTLTIGLEGAISREYGDDTLMLHPYSHSVSERDASHSSSISAPDDLELCL